MRLRRWIIGAYYAAVLAVVGPLLLAGSSHRAQHVTLDLPREAPTLAPAPTGTLAAPLVASPSSARSPAAPAQRPVKRPAAVPIKPPILSAGIPQLGGVVATLATHYRRWSPRTCWDAAGSHVLQELTLYFTAIRGLPCGTVVVITGPLGSVRAIVWDHGPNCDCPERGLDLGEEVFAETVAPLSKGIGPATWEPTS